MRALVVYQSLWGNTASVAKAVAEGIGGDTCAVTTSEATGELVEGLDLLVAGAPLLGFSLPTEQMLAGIPSTTKDSPTPADVSQPPMGAWLEALPGGTGACAAFETRIWWSPGSAAKALAKGLEGHGYRSIAKPAKFVVTGRYGPLKAGELDRARAWGEQLAGQLT